MGIALCFLIGFWPWILLPLGVSIILGALYKPITTGINSTGYMAGPQPNQPPPPPQAPGTYQEGRQQYLYPPQTKQEYGQSQTQHPQDQEMPLQQQ